MQIERNWPDLMMRMNNVILSSDISDGLSSDLVNKGWLGYPGATEDEIRLLEQRLNVNLPPSYRKFLSFSNGWQGKLSWQIDDLLPANKVDWFSILHENWLKVFSDPALLAIEDELITDEFYFEDLGDFGDAASTRHRYLKNCLAISGRGDGAILLLNPAIVFEHGEWEAWFFANWLPGAQRYRSFWDLMQSLYKQISSSEP